MTFLDFNAIIAADIIAACYMRKGQVNMPNIQMTMNIYADKMRDDESVNEMVKMVWN